MELYQTDSHYIILDGDYSLWCSRTTGELEPKSGHDLCSAWNPICIGRIYGLIGKLKIHPDSEWKLLLIRQHSLVGKLAGEHDIYKIEKIAVLSLSKNDNTDLDLELCKKHHFGMKKPERILQPSDDSRALQKTWKTIKLAAENVKPKKKEVKDKEKFEKRIMEELLKMYNDSDFFFYSNTYDLTNSVQQQHKESYDRLAPLCRRADERFFWNKHMLLELETHKTHLAEHWIVPIIQGYVQMEKCKMDFNEDKKDSSSDSMSEFMNNMHKDPLEYNISIFSRRSRHRAGTRSKTRGINENGSCANYVETEQIIEFSPHLVSFVQVRGSIPVFWSQSGFKYRPPPRLDKDKQQGIFYIHTDRIAHTMAFVKPDEEESHNAFKKHFEEQLLKFNKVVIVSLAELSGKEQIVGDAYLSQVLKYNSADLTYITFDFHEYCRGMKFENVSLLTEGIREIIKDMRYCWVDKKGMICEQRGVFRINCIDCLDRTNVVQTAIARIAMETQFRKLGLLPPEETLPQSCRLTYQQIWADNGDIISRQYAGTAALKGDFTRTGERKLTGMMKDGMNSANRYYLRFKDAYRQAAVDISQGQPVSDDLMSLGSRSEVEDDTIDLIEKEENVKMLLEDCKRMLIVEPEQCLGGWSLINADTVEGDPDRQEMDMILLLSQRAMYIAWYDDEEEAVTQYQRIFLEDLDKIEIGIEPTMFRSRFTCLRLHYHHLADEGFFHTFRVPSTRLFNNITVAVKDKEDAKESLKAICETFVAAQKILSLDLECVERQKLDRKKRAPHPEVTNIHKQQQENSLAGIRLPRDISTEIPGKSPVGITDDSLFKSETKLNPDEELQQTSDSSKIAKSPISFLPAVLRQPFTKQSFSILNKNFPNMPKVSLQDLNPVKFVKNGPFASVKISKVFNMSHYSSSESEEGVCADDEDLVLDSCGILATSPSNLLLKTSASKTSEQSRSTKRTEIIIEPASEDPPHTENDLQLFSSDDRNSNFPSEQLATEQEISNDKDQEIVKFEVHQTAQQRESGSFNVESVGDKLRDESVLKPAERDNYSEMFTAATKHNSPRSSRLHHSNMKVSLSDTSITLGKESDELVASKKIIAGNTSPFSRLKLRMANLSLPTSGTKGQVLIHKGMLRKSQKMLENFDKMAKEKLGDGECHSRIIFI